MALNMVLETLEGVEETTAKLYIEKDGKYYLDVADHDKNVNQGIPKSRLDAEIAKRRESETTMAEIAQGFVEEIPEDMRDIIPDLQPAAKIRWIQNAVKKGLFVVRTHEGIDTKRPGSKPAANYDGMSPTAIMAQGYKTK